MRLWDCHLSPDPSDLRWSEAIGLRLRDVDFLRPTLTVAQTVEEVAGRVRVVGLTKSEASRRTMSVPAFLPDELDRSAAQHLDEMFREARARAEKGSR